jgi:phage terminase small subunit
MPQAMTTDSLSALSPRRALFVREYLTDLNGTKAAIRAGYSPASAARHAHDMLHSPEVAAAVQAAMRERATKLNLQADDVLRMLVEVVTADPNDVVQTRRLCCRYCWGVGFRYQRTAREMARDRAQHEADQECKRKADVAFEPQAFDEAGGEDFYRLREPNEECPECCGDGELDVHVADSRLLTGSSRRLFAAVKTTKEGVEVKMRDQDKALELLGRHLAMFTDKVEHSGSVDLANAVLAARRRTVAPEPGEDLC